MNVKLDFFVFQPLDPDVASLERQHTARSRSALRRTRRGRGRLLSTAVTGEPPTWDHLTCNAFTIFVLQGFWATWTSATGVRDKRHLVTPGNPVLRWGGIFSICFTFSVFCLIYRQSRVQVYMVNMYKISSREVSWFPVICRYHLWDIILSPKPGEHQEFYMFYMFRFSYW